MGGLTEAWAARRNQGSAPSRVPAPVVEEQFSIDVQDDGGLEDEEEVPEMYDLEVPTRVSTSSVTRSTANSVVEVLLLKD